MGPMEDGKKLLRLQVDLSGEYTDWERRQKRSVSLHGGGMYRVGRSPGY